MYVHICILILLLIGHVVVFCHELYSLLEVTCMHAVVQVKF